MKDCTGFFKSGAESLCPLGFHRMRRKIFKRFRVLSAVNVFREGSRGNNVSAVSHEGIKQSEGRAFDAYKLRKHDRSVALSADGQPVSVYRAVFLHKLFVAQMIPHLTVAECVHDRLKTVVETVYRSEVELVEPCPCA